eukprot:265022_1
MSKNDKLLSKMFPSNDINDITMKQLLDSIHCHYFHSFDIGLKLTNVEKSNVINAEIKTNDPIDQCMDYDVFVSRINNITQSKCNTYRNIGEFNRLNTPNSKYADTLQMYDYGVRFYYWSYSASLYHKGQENDEVLPKSFNKIVKITKKYINFKQELTQNANTCISLLQFNHLLNKAYAHKQTMKVKKLFCPRTTSAKFYDMKPKQLMSLHHLVAMMAYCNFDILQYSFSNSFRKSDKNESIEMLKIGHRNFYFFAKLLRECAECFGTEFNPPNPQKMSVFTGVNQNFMFHSLRGDINGPISTSRNYSVALNFAGHDGMILEMCIDVLSWNIHLIEAGEEVRIKCVDMQWLSDFPNEQEIFCIGGSSSLMYKSIIQTSTANNYEIYISGLRALTEAICADVSSYSPSTLEKQMLFRLLSHRLKMCIPNIQNEKIHKFESCPQYIQQILDLHCINVSTINLKANNHVIDYLFKDMKTGWFNLDLMLTVFPNTKHITYMGQNKDIKWLTQSSIYDSVLEFIVKQTNVSLISIQIYCDRKYQKNIHEFIVKYNRKFQRYLWTLSTNLLDFRREGGWDNNSLETITSLMDHYNNNKNEFKEVTRHNFIKSTQKNYGFTDDQFINASRLQPTLSITMINAPLLNKIE